MTKIHVVDFLYGTWERHCFTSLVTVGRMQQRDGNDQPSLVYAIVEAKRYEHSTINAKRTYNKINTDDKIDVERRQVEGARYVCT